MARARPVFLAGLLFAAAPVFAAPTPLYQEGLLHFGNGEYAAAIDAFTRVLLENPRDAQTRDYLIRAGDALTAERLGARSVRREKIRALARPAEASLLRRRAAIRRATLALQSAEAAARTLAPTDVLNALPAFDLYYDALDDGSPAARRMTRAFAALCGRLREGLQSTDGWAPSDRALLSGYAAACDANWTKAANDGAKARRLAPGDTRAKNLLDRAERSRRFIEIARLQAEAEKLYAEGKPGEAASLYEKILSLEPAYARARQGLAKARRASETRKRDAKKAELWRSARRHEEAGRWLAAAQDWLGVLRLDPSDAGARASLDKIQERLSAPLRGAPEPAAPPPSPAPAGAPRDAVEAEKFYTLGRFDYADGRLAKARDNFRKSLSLDPEHKYAARALQRVEDELRLKAPGR